MNLGTALTCLLVAAGGLLTYAALTAFARWRVVWVTAGLSRRFVTRYGARRAAAGYRHTIGGQFAVVDTWRKVEVDTGVPAAEPVRGRVA